MNPPLDTHAEIRGNGTGSIVAADKLHNARSMARDPRQHGDLIWQRFRGEQAGTCWYLREIGIILAKRWPGLVVDHLAELVLILEATTPNRQPVSPAPS